MEADLRSPWDRVPDETKWSIEAAVDHGVPADSIAFYARWWQLESLYRANTKYRPIWEPRFVLYRRSSDLPRIIAAYAHAEGFLELPSISLHRRRAIR